MASRKVLLNRDYDVHSHHHMITRQATLSVFASVFHTEKTNVNVAPICIARWTECMFLQREMFKVIVARSEPRVIPTRCVMHKTAVGLPPEPLKFLCRAQQRGSRQQHAVSAPHCQASYRQPLRC